MRVDIEGRRTRSIPGWQTAQAMRKVIALLSATLLGLVLALAPTSSASANPSTFDVNAEWTGTGIQYNFEYYDGFLCPSHATWIGNFATEQFGRMHVVAIVPLCDRSTTADASIRVSGAGGVLTGTWQSEWDSEWGNGSTFSQLTGKGRFRTVMSESTISIDRDLGDFDWPIDETSIWVKPGHGRIQLHLVFPD